jgi:hypothetical protein
MRPIVEAQDIMESERVNQTANLLSDLQKRTMDLRRYL